MASALLQITEPGQAALKESKKQPPVRLAGIDLGTTHSLIALPQSADSADILPIDGHPLMPSAVYWYRPDPPLVGRPALEQAESTSRPCFVSFKRAMGKSAGELQAASLPFAITKASAQPDAPALLSIADQLESAQAPEALSAQVLAKLAQQAQEHLGGPLEGAVITVPAYFDDNQRHATLNAAKLAGIPVLRLIAEPTAAALAYGLHEQAVEKVLVYDLGGGTFDCSVLVQRQGVFEVRATSGDTALGGDDIDRALAQTVLERHQLQPADLQPQQAHALMQRCRAAKEQLSDQSTADIVFEAGAPDSVQSYNYRCDRPELASICQSLIQRTLAFCRRALREAEIEREDLQAVVLVGGSTRLQPLIDQVAEFFPCPLHQSIDPDQAVALGAALHARALSQPSAGSLLVDVVPLSLGIEMLGGLTETVIPRNTPIPAIKAREFTTAQDNQSAMSIHVLQGERSLAKDCRSLARFSLSGIPAGPAGSARIRLLFNVDENGLLSVSAQEQQTGQQVQVACDRAHSFDRGELRQLLEASEQNLDQDQQQKRHIQAEVDARQLLQSLVSALASSGNDLLNTDERTEIEAQMADLEHQIAEANLPGMRRLTAELSEHTDFFAQRRMNQAAQSMLQGRNIDEVAAPSALEPK